MHTKFRVLWLILFISFISSCNVQTAQHTEPASDMNYDYDKAWEKVDSLDRKSLPGSARELVLEIYQQAKADDLADQLLKSVIFRAKYIQILEEDGLENAITSIKTELDSSSKIEKAVLYSMLGEAYMRYAEANQWTISRRTELLNDEDTVLQNWTLERLYKESLQAYIQSLEFDTTKYIDIQALDLILTGGKNNEGLRPTLFDLLANRAIDHFLDGRSFLNEPSYKFTMRDERYFAPSKNFVDMEIPSRDTTSAHWRALRIFQELSNLHLQRNDIAALIDIELKRLRFVEQESVFDEKEKAYRESLRELSRLHRDKDQFSEIEFYRAQSHYQEGLNYQPNPQGLGRWSLKKARDIAISAIEKYPDSFGAKKCRALLQDIESKEWRTTVETVIPAENYSKFLLEYKNLEKLHIKIVGLNYEEAEALGARSQKDLIDRINKFEVINKWDVDLPKTEDFRRHSTEIKVDPIDHGHYLLVTSISEDFDSMIEYTEFHVSDLALIHRRVDEKMEALIVDRTNGTPQAGVEITLLRQVYAQRMRKMEWKEEGVFSTDKDGKVILDLSPREYYRLTCKINNDYWKPDTRLTIYPIRTPDTYERTHIFTDRSIYRPGQVVYYKAYLLHFDNQRMPEVIKGKKFDVTLKDVNGQEIVSQKLESNEFGTAHGSFVLPSGGLTGRFSIVSSIGRSVQSIQVEEYKRPRFEVNMDTLQDIYTLGDTVTAQGSAINYAGTPVDGAKVAYRVVRLTRFPYWPWWRGYTIPYRTEEMEIARGVTFSSERGSFEVPFVAIPDESIPRADKPIFEYRVEVDVTDLAGETRSATDNFRVGYTALNFEVNVPTRLSTTDRIQIELTSRNLNNAPVKTTVSVGIETLKTPDRVFRKRIWQRPDTQLISKDQFIEWFPHDAFGEEDEMHAWEPINTVYNEEKEIEGQYVLDLKSRLSAGEYRVTFQAIDPSGEEIEIIKHFTVFEVGKALPYQYHEFTVFPESDYSPGDSALILQAIPGSAWVWYEAEDQNGVFNAGWNQVDNWLSKEILIQEKHRGNLYFRTAYILNNRHYSKRSSIKVPWSNKELTVDYLTFRDKTKPGANEKWKIKISGANKDQVSAEFLSSMYDASLDQFLSHNWNMNIWPMYNPRWDWRFEGFGSIHGRDLGRNDHYDPVSMPVRNYRQLKWFGLSWYENRPVMFRNQMMEDEAMAAPVEAVKMQSKTGEFESDEQESSEAPEYSPSEDTVPKDPGVQVRENLNETVFFYPALRTDSEGNVLIEFTMNEALTRWKFMGLAHSTDLAYAFTEHEIVTQKDLMVLPNPPRFFRQGDSISFSAKVSNLTDTLLKASVNLELFNTLNDKPLDNQFGNDDAVQHIDIEPGRSAGVNWSLEIPKDISGVVTYRVIAKSGNRSDGEQATLPILTNRMLVTETLPLWTGANESKSFNFRSLSNAHRSESLTHHRYTLEYTSNPTWYAIRSLPYIMESSYECTEQIFNRLFANSLASHIIRDNPGIKKVYEEWQRKDALKSPLSKNQELKQLLLSETPWVLEAQSEDEQMQRIALLFDLNQMSNQEATAVLKLTNYQQQNGGFPWFAGGRDNWYITQYLIEGFGHLEKLGVPIFERYPQLKQVMEQAVGYCDDRVNERYDELKQRVEKGNAKWKDDHLSPILIHYLYARSFFTDQPLPAQSGAYYLDQAATHWTGKSQYEQGMIGMSLGRMEKEPVRAEIIRSLMERSISDPELGMYWKYQNGWFWYQMPIETQSLMIELFAEADMDTGMIDKMKIWLLKNKQTNSWSNTKSTAAAIYALLQKGSKWLDEDEPVIINVEGLDVTKMINNSPWREAGTNYFKVSVDGEAISTDMSKIEVKNPNDVITWGAAYWQYFEDLDKIDKFEETPLKLSKQLYRVDRTDFGEKLMEVSKDELLQVGDLVRVRILLQVDRNMEFIHLKDMRASGLEPINVISRYKWQDGLGYYESTRDASTDFFMDMLPRGSYVFEYDLRVFHAGIFSNGISTIQCMYAPEFSSHSKGERIEIKR